MKSRVYDYIVKSCTLGEMILAFDFLSQYCRVHPAHLHAPRTLTSLLPDFSLVEANKSGQTWLTIPKGRKHIYTFIVRAYVRTRVPALHRTYTCTYQNMQQNITELLLNLYNCARHTCTMTNDGRYVRAIIVDVRFRSELS